MRIRARALATGAVALASLAVAGPGVARAQGPVITVQDGKTQPVFSYQDAIRERVFIPVAGVDSDSDGATDRVAIDIIRPKESGASLKVPAIIDDSPYLTSLGRGNESQRIHTTAAGVLDKFPLFYDNYFVPRGYAVILAQAVGTAFSTGCALHGGPGDVAGFKAVIDWTEGRVPGYTSLTGTTPVLADWSNGKNAMIGKSYDGTFANGVAATGVDGLTTIVPISAIGAWYDYSRGGGVRYTAAGTHYPYFLSNAITQDQPASVLGVQPPQGTGVSRNSICGGGGNSARPGSIFDTQLSQRDGDASGDYNDFWQERNYLKDVSKVKAAVFASHGINDDNVRPNHFSQWWAGLAANNVPRKVWLSEEGHVDPFEYRRSAWVDTLHRWFDFWLQGVQNGIMNEPRVDIEQQPGDVWKTYADYPIPGTVDTDVFLAGRSAGTSGSLGLASGGATDTLTFQDPPTGNVPSEATFQNTPNGSQANRLVFLTTKLKQDVHISGTPVIDVQASLSSTQTNFAGLLVDYGPFTKVGRGGDGTGVQNTSNPVVRTCWGDSSTDASGNPVDSACYIEVTKPTQSGTSWRVSRGLLDSQNRDSLFTATPAVTGTKYEFRWPILPTDYTFPAGHQIGVVLVANDSGNGGMGVAGTRGTSITVDTKNSKIILPITGGAQAAGDSGAFVPDTTAPVITAAPDQTFYVGDPTGGNINYALPVVTDTQDPDPTVNCAPARNTKFNLGATLVNCTVTDANGNSTPTSFNVNVRFAAQAPGDVNGSVPATLSLALGPPAAFGAFTPGVTGTYTTSGTATVTSTAGDALLTVADPSSNATGHLVNGAFSLPQPLQARGRRTGTTGGAFGNVGSSAAPLSLLTWNAPVSNDPVTLDYQQLINMSDALRTGSYSKTLTYTLSTTNP